MRTTIIPPLTLSRDSPLLAPPDAPLPNTLTSGKRPPGGGLLLDGQTAEGWRTPRSEKFPTGDGK